jgi:hypothetical protein
VLVGAPRRTAPPGVEHRACAPMETQHDLTGEPDEPTGALDDDNPDLPDDAGETGAGDATGASGGLEGGSEPQGEDARHHERP